MPGTWMTLMLVSALLPAVFITTRPGGARVPVAAFALADAAAFACWLVAVVPASEVLLRRGDFGGAVLLWMGLLVATGVGGVVYLGMRDALQRQGTVSSMTSLLTAAAPVLVHGFVIVRTAVLN